MSGTIAVSKSDMRAAWFSYSRKTMPESHPDFKSPEPEWQLWREFVLWRDGYLGGYAASVNMKRGMKIEIA